MLKIQLIGSETTACLVGVDGDSQLVSSGSRHFLEGNFVLEIFGSESEPLRFRPAEPGAARVELRNGEWVLVELTSIVSFRFAARVRIAATSSAVSASFSRIGLQQQTRDDSVALLNFLDIAASLIPSDTNDESESLAILKSGGKYRVQIRPRPWPDQTSASGYYLKYNVNGAAAISLGSISDRAVIDFLDELELRISTRAEIWVIPKMDGQGNADPALTIFPMQAGGNVARVIVSERHNAGLRFADDPRSRSSRRLKGKRLEVRSNTLILREFDVQYLDARIERDDALVSAKGITRLFGPEQRFAFAQELVTENEVERGFAQLIYSVDEDKLVSPQEERFYGPRVRGLGDARGNLPALDANIAVLDLGQESRQFDLKAGGTIPLVGQVANSVLQPKLNQRSDRRVLDVPVDDMVLRVEDNPHVASPIIVDVDSVRLPGAELIGPPLGISAVDLNATAGAPYAEWALKHSEGEVVFGLSDEGLTVPPPTVALSQEDEENWLESFETSNPKKEYKSVEQHELKLRIDLPGRSRIGFSRTKVKKVKDPSGKEKTAYSAFFATLTYASIELINAISHKTWKMIGASELDLGFEKLGDEASTFVKRNGLKDLVISYNLGDAAHKQAFKDFVNRNRPEEPHKRVLLPISKVVGIVLWDDADGEEKWADDIAASIAGNSVDTALAFDFSSDGGLDPSDVGWGAGTTWSKFAKDAETLWPRARAKSDESAKKGARLDPSDSAWRGFFFHDVPASVILPKELLGSITGGAPLVKQLIDLLQNKLFVEYAWRDAHGATFSAGLVDPIQITPESWDSVVKITVTGLHVKGAPIDGSSSGIVQAEGSVEVEFPWWTDEGEPLVAEGRFQLDLTAKDPINSFKIRLTKAYSGEPKIPGIKKLRLIDWEFDLKTLNLVVGATGDEDLAKALPFLNDDKEVIGSLFLNLGDEPQNKFSLILPTDIETKLFGKWALSISAIALMREEVAGESIFQTRFRGGLDMGLPVLSSIGADVTISNGADDKWELDVELQQIGVELDIGDMTFNGEVNWERLPGKGEEENSEDPGPDGRVRSDLVARAGREREFYAFLNATGGLFGDGWKLVAKSGNAGGMTYFIGAVQADGSIKLASMELKDPALLLAYNADSDGKLKKSFNDVTVVIKDVLRPVGKTNEELRKWLKPWKPSTEIGTLVAASGYLNVNSQVAKAPEKDQSNLTSIAYSDRGMFRVDAQTLVLGSLKMQFALTIDTRAKYVEAGFQLPSVNYPPTGKPQYVVSPGYLVLGAGYKRGEERFKLSIGWPEPIGDDGYERDWNKSMTVKVADMVPINTFWGGVKAELDLGSDFLYLGFAIRAGWTRSYEVNGANIAKASAELGVAVGGVFEFQLNWDENEAIAEPRIELAAPRWSVAADEAMRMSVLAVDRLVEVDALKVAEADDLRRIEASLRIMGAAAASMESVEVRLAATIYGDLWGSASVEFLGVRIAAISVRAYSRFKVCGSSTAGILVMKAAMGFEVSITILCVSYSTTARIDIILRDEPCSFRAHRNTLALENQMKLLAGKKHD